ncbi:serine permease, partial [Francisella tularensis subsp. holarctica]|nr:serine permease [Francisella tularensis subsp. holarctica]
IISLCDILNSFLIFFAVMDESLIVLLIKTETTLGLIDYTNNILSLNTLVLVIIFLLKLL